jgi:DNA-binding NarL/FixJ family response regulator
LGRLISTTDEELRASILIVDDHEVVRQGVRTILRARPDWTICGEAANGEQGIEAVKQLDPDVVILDITMPVMSGLEAASRIAKLGVHTSVLIFTMHESERLIAEVRAAGAQGFVHKSRAGPDLILAIDALLSGGTFFGVPGKSSSTSKERDPSPGLSFLRSFCFA